MNHADIKGLNLMEGWEILNTYLYIIRRVMEIKSRVFKGLRPSGRQILKPCGRKTFNFVFEHLFKIVYLHIKLVYPSVDSIIK